MLLAGTHVTDTTSFAGAAALNVTVTVSVPPSVTDPASLTLKLAAGRPSAVTVTATVARGVAGL